MYRYRHRYNYMDIDVYEYIDIEHIFHSSIIFHKNREHIECDLALNMPQTEQLNLVSMFTKLS